ncbi:MAG: redoxin domain-containing protein [Cyclobacteriaceae bacterium]
MRIPALFLALLLFISYTSIAQDGYHPFEIAGKINADTGEVILEVLFDHDYYPEQVERKMVSTIEDGKFSFSGHIPYPQGFTISYSDRYYSRVFVVDPGYQAVSVDVEARREAPKADNLSMNEYETQYLPFYEPIVEKRKLHSEKRATLREQYQGQVPDSIQLVLETEINQIYMESDSTLLRYVQINPDSYVALWNFINLFSGFGYQKVFDAVYAAFSDSLKDTHAGKVLAQKLAVASKLDYGKTFPSIALADEQNQPWYLKPKPENKYTFIDFWYSNCHPCIAQFPYLRETYQAYKSQGFEVIGISTDRTRYKENWEKAIEKYQLSWPQYWDQNGVESSKLSINKFPSNFLLDQQGKIIKKDLRPVELEQFLKENI